MPSSAGLLCEERIPYVCSRHRSHCKHKRYINKAKENIYKLKCSQALKRKLKKYKLRKDGAEDQDVLDVSQTLKITLNIRSPNKSGNIICELEERPRNYLFKMGRRKQTLKESNGIENDSANSIMASQEVKTPANAFKLLMDSRNKSIGGNSPGKDKTDDSPESIEKTEKRDAKAKRLLVLQKMADAKGSSKKKEIEQLQDECIKIKMDKRAERLKAMLVNSESIKPPKKAKEKKAEPVCKFKNNKKLSPKNECNVIKSLNIIDMFIENDNANRSPESKPLLKEEEEFLNKLSPSIRKKENMLCYFKKIDKDKSNLEEVGIEDKDSLIIKVKLKPRNKLKKKLSLKKNHNHSPLEETSLIASQDNEPIAPLFKTEDTKSDNSKPIEDNKSTNREKCEKQERRKRKLVTTENIQVVEESLRPKRHVRKPLKYNDDVFLTSSDEELKSTPKKKKHIDKGVKSKKISVETIEIVADCEEIMIPTNKEKIVVKEKLKPTSKLAPIFNPKSQITAEATEAKLRFLQSGVPEKLKKKLVQQRSYDSLSNDFTTVVHVQQLASSSIEKNNAPKDHFQYKYDGNHSDDDLNFSDISINSFLNIEHNKTTIKPTPIVENVKNLLQNMKVSYPKFPVYRTYHSLKNKSKGEIKDCNFPELDNSIEILSNLPDLKNESPDKLMWSDKYRPLSSKQIIGNFETVRELKKWLETWTEYEDRKNSNKNSDSSDFLASDTDSRDSIRCSKNLLIITGPVGSGKTSAVYAVAAELAIKVIEVNASSRRTGKIMLQDLQEATQSHKVNRSKNSQDNSQKSIDIESTQPKKRGRKKKVVEKVNKKLILSHDQASSQESAGRTCMSLILIDDADIIFDQDDGFCSAVTQLAHCSKRPVILITRSLQCPHLQRFVQSARILKTNPFIPKMLGTWLDIMCLADTSKCYPGMGSKLLDYFKGDVRKTINQLQFYMCTETCETLDSQNSDSYRTYLEEENSNITWVDTDQDLLQQKEKVEQNNTIPSLHQFRDQDFSPTTFDYWWNIPKLTNSEQDNQSADTPRTNLDTIANALDTFSSIDYIRNSQPYGDITTNPWYTFESDSVVEIENKDTYDMTNVVCNDMSSYLGKESWLEVQRILGDGTAIEIEPPVMAEQRQKDRIVSRHNTLTSFLNPSSALDRKALSLDYWSACRSICRIEKAKSDGNIRRNNRFCHYLKTSNILCKSESFDYLCDSLKPFWDT